jgi:flagellar M-ring protein FliF
MAQAPAQTLNALRTGLGNLSTPKKLALAGGIALVVALFIVAWAWMRSPEYRVLYSNVSERDGGDIIASLSQMQLPYRIAGGGTTILVPDSAVYEARLKLATQGLPRGGAVGFELMDSQKFGVSQFMEQLNYQRALAGELSRTIQSMAPVQSARVHIAVPRPSVFVREQQKPSASVLVNIHPGRTLDAAQVGAIAHLVASSVPELSARNVTVVDQSGKLLSAKAEGPATGLDSSQLEYVHAVEQRYVRRIEDILEPIVGAGSVCAQVAADLDFSQSEQTYKPNATPKDSSIRSQQTVETISNQPNPPAGVPGALSNQPPGAASAPLVAPGPQPVARAAAPVPSNTHKENTVNFEIDKTIRHVKAEVGAVKRLSVAVVVNYRVTKEKKKPTALTEPELLQINNLVREAMGFNKDRGDSVNVVNAPFSGEPPEEAVSPWRSWMDRWMAPEGVMYVAKYLGFALILIYAWFGLLRPCATLRARESRHKPNSRRRSSKRPPRKRPA